MDVTRYWTEPPPSPSRGLLKWQKKFAAGWRPNRRIRAMGYQERAEFFGVYLWEYREILYPMIEAAARRGS